MSDNIPFDVQMEIVKRISSVKSLIQFRSVSKQWKSFIDTSEFIKDYGARHTHPHSHILSKISDYDYDVKEPKYIHLVDDDMETFKVRQPPFVVSHLLKRCHIRSYFGGVIGSSYGLSCLFTYNLDIRCYMLVIWNPSIGKSWESYDNRDHMVVSFDLITHEFKVVNLPDALKKLSGSLSLSELRGSLVVCEFVAGEAGVWVMGQDSSFRKLFTICAPRIRQILGFKKNGETIFISRSQYLFERPNSVLNVYDTCYQPIKNLGISGEDDSFFMGSYKESLLLLDHLDSHVYYDNSYQNDDGRHI